MKSDCMTRQNLNTKNEMGKQGVNLQNMNKGKKTKN